MLRPDTTAAAIQDPARGRDAREGTQPLPEISGRFASPQHDSGRDRRSVRETYQHPARRPNVHDGRRAPSSTVAATDEKPGDATEDPRRRSPGDQHWKPTPGTFRACIQQNPRASRRHGSTHSPTEVQHFLIRHRGPRMATKTPMEAAPPDCACSQGLQGPGGTSTRPAA